VDIKLNEQDRALYSRLHVSNLDLGFAGYCLRVLLKNGWHHKPWERRGTVYLQQAAFTSALVTAYARPFTASKGWPTFPHELMNFDVEETALHKRMLDLRHSIYAHSVSKHYKVVPIREEGFSSDLLSEPWLLITAQEGALLQKMIVKLKIAIELKSKELVPDVLQKPRSVRIHKSSSRITMRQKRT
jgi:hypothetical protein